MHQILPRLGQPNRNVNHNPIYTTRVYDLHCLGRSLFFVTAPAPATPKLADSIQTSWARVLLHSLCLAKTALCSWPRGIISRGPSTCNTPRLADPIWTNRNRASVHGFHHSWSTWYKSVIFLITFDFLKFPGRVYGRNFTCYFYVIPM